MKKLLCVLFIFLLCACSNDAYNTITIDEQSLTIGKKIDNENYHVEDGSLYLNDKYIGEVTMKKDKVVGLDVYLYDVRGEIYINDYLLTKSVSETCEHFEGKCEYKKGAVCIINRDGDNGTNTMVFYANVFDQVTDELDHFSIFVK